MLCDQPPRRGWGWQLGLGLATGQGLPPPPVREGGGPIFGNHFPSQKNILLLFKFHHLGHMVICKEGKLFDLPA